MSGTAHGTALARRLARAERRAAAAGARACGLREELAVAQSVVTGLRRQVEGRDATIRATEAERDEARTQAAELAEALAAACATPPVTVAERNIYRAALADIEAVLHRLGDGCGFGHNGGND